MDFAVVAEDLTQRYKRTQVFQGLDVRIGRSVTGLLGPNGAGKTTLLRTICTLHRPQGGSLNVLGLDATRSAEVRQIRGKIGYLPQSFGYYPAFSVRDFVEYAAWLKKVPSVTARQQVQEAIEAVGLEERASSSLRSLSGGMLRRAGIAHAIVNRPDLLVLDEPTAGLDPQQRIELRALLRRIGETAAVIVSTHLVEDVRAVANEIQILDQGRLVFTGTTAQLESGAVEDAEGDSVLEKGYSTVLRRSKREESSHA